MSIQQLIWSLAAIANIRFALAVPQKPAQSTNEPDGVTTATSLIFPTVNPTASTAVPVSVWSASTTVTPTTTTQWTAWPEKPACSAPSYASSLSVPSSAPSDAYTVPGDFVGFGFETAFLNDYANTFSENLVNSVAKRLSKPVIIRIGGTSGDQITYNPDQSEIKVCISGDCPVGSSASYILGPSYFKGFTFFQDQHFSFQAPLSPFINYTNALDYVYLAYNTITPSRVAAIAIGNEPDDYSGGYNVSYTYQNYVNDSVALEQHIIANLSLTQGQEIFEIVDLAAGASGNFTVENVFANGGDSTGLVKYAAEHWYQIPTALTTFNPKTLQLYLMNHTAIVQKFNAGYAQANQYILSNFPNVSYVISESGSGLTGPPQSFQDAFGACLWAVDFNLYSMSQGVKRVDGTGRPAAHHSLWVPDNSTNSPSLGTEQNIGPQVRGPYFATPFLADFVGKDPGQVTQVLASDTHTAYAMYSGTQLSKIALVNLVYWSADQGNGPRGNTTYSFPVPSGTNHVKVEFLNANAGAHAQGYDVQGTRGIITWAGETWSYDLDHGRGSRVAGVPKSERVKVCGGVANIRVPDSAAAIVYIPGLG